MLINMDAIGLYLVDMVNLFNLLMKSFGKGQAVLEAPGKIILGDAPPKLDLIDDGDCGDEPLKKIETEYPPIGDVLEIIRATYEKFPEWYGESLLRLHGWRIKGETSIEIARRVKPEQLNYVYFRLNQLLPSHFVDTEQFIRLVPKVLKYPKNRLNVYITTLDNVLTLADARFGESIPKQYDWKRVPSLFTLEALPGLESSLESMVNHETDMGTA